MSVYLIAAEEVGMAKIGTARDVDARFRALQGANPHKLRLVKQRAGDSALEASIHRACADMRVRGEWFQYNNRLVEIFDSVEHKFSIPAATKKLPDWDNPSAIIKIAILASGMNKTEFGKAVGLSHTQLWKLLNNKCRPQEKTCRRIEEFIESLLVPVISKTAETLSDGVEPKIGRAA